MTNLADDAPLETVSFHGLAPGPKLIVTGAVHGDEVCGPIAIARAIEDCRSGGLTIARGEVTFLPVANPKAKRLNTREGDRNLNRDLRDKPLPADNEDRVGNAICALLRRHDVLLDIHSFRGEGEPFAFFGPENNAGTLEPFNSAAEEASFAACLGVDMLIHGWLELYVKLIAARARLGLPPLSATEGYGTTEYMRWVGGYATTLECGRHDDPAAADIGYAAIHNALAHLNLIDAPRPGPRRRTVIHMADLVICEREGDRLEGVWKTGDRIGAGQTVARRADQSSVAADRDGFVIFPNPHAKLGEGICYLGAPSRRTI